MRGLLFGALAAAAAGAALYAMIVVAEISVFDFGIGGVVPIGWLVFGAIAGGAAGFGASGRSAYAVGAIAGALGLFAAHAAQYAAVFRAMTPAQLVDPNFFRLYLESYAAVWELGWHYYYAAPLGAAMVGALIAPAGRTEAARAALPDWVSPTARIMIHMARADGSLHQNEVMLVIALVHAQLAKSMGGDVTGAVTDLVNAELKAAANEPTMDAELNAAALKSRARRLSAFKLAIALAQCDGEVSQEEAALLDRIARAWEIPEHEISALADTAMDEFKSVIEGAL
ncbi:MAG: TerB family tellurite resistance protein [Pseudomonadota bacterium]